jgi:proteasome lid subunit RPN8/RPN11
MLRISKADYEKIIAHARENLPEEACGLIAGEASGDIKEIKKVYLLTNVDHTNEHFSIDPKEQLLAVKDMRANGLFLLGNWHSHPETPARPSEEDKRLAYDPNVSYLILSLMNRDEPVLKAFLINKEREVSTEEIEVE